MLAMPDESEEADEAPAAPQPIDTESCLADLLPLGWRAASKDVRLKVPHEFACAILDYLLVQEDHASDAFPISWAELTVLLLRSGKVEFPVVCPVTGGWCISEGVSHQHARLTFAAQLRLLQETVSSVLKALGVTDILLDGISLASLGYFRPAKGLKLMVDPFDLLQARETLIRFTARRPIRTAADLARPLSL